VSINDRLGRRLDQVEKDLPDPEPGDILESVDLVDWARTVPPEDAERARTLVAHAMLAACVGVAVPEGWDATRQGVHPDVAAAALAGGQAMARAIRAGGVAAGERRIEDLERERRTRADD
jgi:hypothetical protein